MMCVGLVNVPLMINGHSYKLVDFATVERTVSAEGGKRKSTVSFVSAI